MSAGGIVGIVVAVVVVLVLLIAGIRIVRPTNEGWSSVWASTTAMPTQASI